MSHDMYTEIILDLYKNPHNKGTLQSKTHEGHTQNPLCGDNVTLQLEIKDDIVKDIKFSGEGCAISQAASSLVTDYVKGKRVEELKNLTPDDIINLLEIPISPGREKCALLCFNTLQEIIQRGEKNNA